MIKTALKLFVGLITGIVAGLAIAAVMVTLFTETTMSEFLANLRSGDAAEAALAAVVGMASFLLSIAILIPVHEAGHLVCGMLSGYRFVSFRIFNLTFIKIDGRLRVRKFSIAGTGGQCLLLPPDRPLDKIPTGWYNAGGVLANVIVLAIVAPLLLLDLDPFMFEALSIFCLTDVIMILTNGVPMKLGGIGNDAYNIALLRRNLSAKEALMIQLRSNAMIQEGVRPSNMPDRWFQWKTDIDWKNQLEVSVPLIYASRLVDEMKWEEACRCFEEMYSHKNDIIQLYGDEIACELAFCLMMTRQTARAGELLDDKIRKYVAAFCNVMSSKQRLLCAIALFLDNDREKAFQIYNGFLASKDRYLMQGEVKSDLAIMKSMLN